jgi:hypothetical protein
MTRLVGLEYPKRQRLKLINYRCASRIRDLCHPTGFQTRDSSKGKAALRLFPQVRITVWRAIANLKAGGPDGRTLP